MDQRIKSKMHKSIFEWLVENFGNLGTGCENQL